MKRRTFLATAATAGVAGLAGCPFPFGEDSEEPPDEGTPTPATPADTAPDQAGEEHIDVTEVGADASGESLIDDVLEDVAADGAHLVLPEGEYKLGKFIGSFTGLTIEGRGARIVPESRSSIRRLLDISGPDNVVEGLTFDYRNVDLPPTVGMRGPDGWKFRNNTFRGVQKTDLPESGRYAFYPEVTDDEGTGLIRNVYMHDGSARPDSADTRGGIWFGPNNQGTIHIDGIWMEYWAENTIYAHNSPGQVLIENSFFRNTNVAGTRVGGNTILRNNTYVKTGPVPRQGWQPPGQGKTMRGVWISGGHRPYGSSGSVLIEDCDFIFLDEENGSSAIVLGYEIDGNLTIRNCRFRQDFRQAIAVQAPSEVVLDNIHITGNTQIPAIGIHPNSPLGEISGRVNTEGPISNRSDVAEAFEDGTATDPDPSPPRGLSKPAGTDPIPDLQL